MHIKGNAHQKQKNDLKLKGMLAGKVELASSQWIFVSILSNRKRRIFIGIPML